MQCRPSKTTIEEYVYNQYRRHFSGSSLKTALNFAQHVIAYG